jgi:hypothetical protein
VESRQARELDEAARELSKAAREIGEAARLLKDLEEVARVSLEGGLPEEAAVRRALEAVHEVRRETADAGGFAREALTLAEAEEWVQRREERRRRDGYRPV